MMRSKSLSQIQKYIWIDQLKNTLSPKFNIGGFAKLKGNIGVENFSGSIQDTVERQDILNWKFSNGDELFPAVSIFREKYNQPIQLLDFSSRINCEEEAVHWMKSDMEVPFDLLENRLFFTILIKCKSSTFWYVKFHHIINDGYGLSIFFKDVLGSYDHAEHHLSKYDYQEFVDHQMKETEGKAYHASKSFWQNKYTTIPPATFEGKTDLDQPSSKLFSFVVGKDVLNRNKQFCAEHGLSYLHLFLGSFLVYIYKVYSFKAFPVILPVQNRSNRKFKAILGPFVNLMPIYLQYDGGQQVLDFLYGIKKEIMTCLRHQEYQLGELLADSDVLLNSGKHFTGFRISYEKHDYNYSFNDENVTVFPLSNNYEDANLSIHIREYSNSAEELIVDLDYNTNVFSDSSIASLSKGLQSILQDLIARPLDLLESLNAVDSEERASQLDAFFDAARFSAKSPLSSRLRNALGLNADKHFLFSPQRRLSNAQINEASDVIAAHLVVGINVLNGQRIGLYLKDKSKYIEALFGIIKTGAVYVPIDTAYPEGRVMSILNSASCDFVISDHDTVNEFIRTGGFRLLLIEELKQALKSPEESLIRVKDPLYLICTSGSTGVPKGAVCNHMGFNNLLDWYVEELSLTALDKTLIVSSLGFDLTQKNLFAAALTGAELHLIDDEFYNPGAILEAIGARKITWINCTPSTFYPILELDAPNGFRNLHSLRYVVLGGESINMNLLSEWYNGAGCHTRLLNTYGPTECTDVTNYYLVPKLADYTDFVLPIGKPIPNVTSLILNPERSLIPAGAKGEICIGGIALGNGYLNDPEKTKEKFIPHPYIAAEKLYCTGDLGRLLPDGNLEFLGRIDNQVKIRGYRIELGEIESHLMNMKNIREAAVVVVENEHIGKCLLAYVIVDGDLNVKQVKNHLTGLLPDFMVPADFVKMDKFPVSANGKVDKNALPDPGTVDLTESTVYLAPNTEVERHLIRIWEEILGKENIGIRDDFFDLGGHSLKISRLMGRINKEFEIRIGPKELFGHPVLEDQAGLITHATQSAYHAIPVAASQICYPLSSSQRRLWILSQFEDGNAAYNIPRVYVFQGSLSQESLTAAFRMLIARHEILRTVFREDEEGEIRQFINDVQDTRFEIDYRDLSLSEDQETVIRELVKADATTPFDLSLGPLLRASLYQTGEDRWLFSYTMHHIISDGWSMGVLVGELLLFYNAHLKGEENRLAPLQIQYKDYACWQQKELKGSTLNASRSYWLKQFEGELPVLELRGDHIRPAIKTYNGAAVELRISAEAGKKLRDLSQSQGCTLFMGLLAVVNTLLYRYTGQQDLIVGSPIAGREYADLEGQIGFYVNTLALRSRFRGEDSFIDLLNHIRQVTLDGYEHQAYPFDELVDELDIPRDLSRNALFDVMVVLEHNQLLEAGGLGGIKASLYQGVETEGSKFDLTFSFEEIGEEIETVISYNSDIYDRAGIVQLSDHLIRLMEAVTAGPSVAIADLHYLSEEEHQQLLHGFNATAVWYPKDKTVVNLFEEQVLNTPDHIALVFEKEQLSYRDLNEKANQFSDYLVRNYGVKRCDFVAIMLERSEWVLIAILGILKSGGAYVPLEVSSPAARKEYMLEECGSRVLIDDQELEKFRQEASSYNGDNSGITMGPADLAYVMYTSGSSGKPKGVMVEHGNVVRLVKSANYVTLTDEEVLLSTGAVSFDATTFEYWAMLLNGGRLVLCSQEVLLNPKVLASQIQAQSVTMMWFTSGWLNQLADEDIEIFEGLKTLLAGGDALSPVHIKALRLRYPDLKILNGYGPTENTTFSLTYPILNPGLNIPVGRPISNSRVYILDSRDQLLPIGVVGEICLAGAGLSRGYLNQPELSRDKFVPDPFVSGERMYKSGDLGRWLPDGNVEFTGRKDDQIKIRGYRIEPGEIEEVLQRYAAISSAVVLVKENVSGEKELVAYVHTEQEISVPDLQLYLARHLPVYMIPGHFIQIDQLPLSPNGKVDKRALLAMNTGRQSLMGAVAYEAPGTEIEAQLVGIWEEVLGIDKIGIKDNFFALGGHSLKAIQLLSRVSKNMGTKIPLKDLFSEPTIEAMANVIMNDRWLKAVTDEDHAGYQKIKI
ncbi:amino acid adenylation domain-containing protein [Pedobacter steynii]|uniref:Amino acid adenylation domain-containing protein n=1 Tax=Pedobacter steynii TaxID=430522 RepID=A0A1H0IWF7_9SPHI|nr:non-ribosomal peptide synthetase [Pedobacter steynii]NQX42958.1 non-ribosomal peptide synthetase [Pedobacter steynii]SDO35672.1 amino acid adenylation domain-containing protein [Pedobacter steynii]